MPRRALKPSFPRLFGALALVTSMASQLAAPVRAAPADEPPPGRPRFALTAAMIGSVGPTQTADPVEAWKQEVAAAKLRRSKARRMEAGGFLLAFGGDILANIVISTNCQSRCSAAPAVVGISALVIGLPIGIVGKIRAHDADGEVNALMTRGPRTSPSATIAVPVGGHQSVGLTLGQTNGVSYRIKW